MDNICAIVKTAKLATEEGVIPDGQYPRKSQNCKISHRGRRYPRWTISTQESKLYYGRVKKKKKKLFIMREFRQNSGGQTDFF